MVPPSCSLTDPRRATVLPPSFPVLHDDACPPMVSAQVLGLKLSDYMSSSFYCMVMLSAIFMSTCYWPPVPAETPLVRPWSENVTTFGDALRYMMPNIPEDKIPSTIPIADRCWCDLSNGFFAPFNTTRWEELSVTRMKESIEKELAVERRAQEKEDCQAAAGEDAAGSSACDVAEEELDVPSTTPISTATLTYPEALLYKAYLAFRNRTAHHPSPPPSVSSPSPTSTEGQSPTEATPSSNEDNATPAVLVQPTAAAQSPSVRHPWVRREYDFRSLGFAMVLDFGWPSTTRSSVGLD